jgi:hypothetical protein
MSQGFNVSVNGNYPSESYSATPIVSLVNPDLGNLAVRNYLKYRKTPTNDIINYLDSSFNSTYVTYSNATYNSNLLPLADTLIYPTLSFASNTSITLNASQLKKDYKNGPELNFFYLQTDTQTNNCYGYIIYPYRWFLNPNSLQKNANSWTLVADQKVQNYKVQYFNSSQIETDASTFHDTYMNTVPNRISPSNFSLNSYNVNYNVYGCLTRTEYPIITYTGDTTPRNVFTLLPTKGGTINPDSTLVSYSGTYIDINNQTGYVSQAQPGVYNTTPYQGFNSTYILKYNKSSNIQTFQLLQSQLNKSLYLGDTTNCVLSSVLNLNTSVIQYFNTQTSSSFKGQANTVFGVNYVADYVTNGVISFSIDNITKSLNTNYSVLSVGDKTIKFETAYPPHYYSYKSTLVDGSNVQYDIASLNFELKPIILTTGITDVNIYTYISSDYGVSTYDLATNNAGELITYKFIGVDPLVLPDLICTVGNTTYTVSNLPFLNVTDGQNININYVGAKYGQTSFTVRPVLSTVFGLIDSRKSLHVTLAQNLNQSTLGSHLTVNVIKEVSNQISIDSSYNISEVTWPSRDLRGSLISWSYYPSDADVTLNAIDPNGNFIQTITANQPLNFSSQNWTVMASGYGPTQISVSLSSMRYNEVATVSTTPRLFDYFKEKKFVVGSLVDLNNLEKTRTITLSAKVPFGNKLYDIPKNTPLYWNWTYDGIASPLIQPIKANRIDGKNYEYSANLPASVLSAVQIKVTPPSVFQDPLLHKITVTVNSDITYPTISGSYSFYVDDFPNFNVFNSDFTTAYFDFSSKDIANTRNSTNIITRASDQNLHFIFKPNTDVLPNITYNSLNWFVNDSIYKTNTDKASTIDLDLSTYNPLVTSVYLTIDSGIINGWTSAHNISAATYLNVLDPSVFYSPLEFIIFPKFAWLSDKKLTLLTPDNYTLSYKPSSYGNTNSSTVNFWLSANKTNYKQFVYTNLNNGFQTVLNSSSGNAEIYYDNSDVSPYIGQVIALECYDDVYYPQNMGTKYFAPSNTEIKQFEFSNSSRTLPIETQTDNNFKLSPYILPYNDLYLTFNLIETSYNLNQTKDIYVVQTLSAIPDNSPAVITGGSVTYTLSSLYWTVNATVPAVSGTYKIFSLNIGDPYVPYFAAGLGLEEFMISSSADLLQQIPPSTFDNYDSTQYSGNRNLWQEINIKGP